ncbi:MAG: hypothetical protein IJN80_01505 [Clostridia bacterium]|nr:hypothetical protein [Clostridia bacterium]
MKRIILFIFIALSLSPIAFAAIGKQGLIINGGIESITLQKGERIRLRVRDKTTNLPVLKDLSFSSDNDLIASIDEDSGILRANSIGTTYISIMRPNGNGAAIAVCVVAKEKKPSPFYLFFILGLGALTGFILRNQF